jgi:hypothetical protein
VKIPLTVFEKSSVPRFVACVLSAGGSAESEVGVSSNTLIATNTALRERMLFWIYGCDKSIIVE